MKKMKIEYHYIELEYARSEQITTKKCIKP